MIAAPPEQTDRKLQALAALLDDPNKRLDCANEEGLVFSAADNRVIGVQTCPVFVILTDAENEDQGFERGERLRKTYGGYRKFAHNGETFHFYSGQFPPMTREQREAQLVAALNTPDGRETIIRMFRQAADLKPGQMGAVGAPLVQTILKFEYPSAT